MIPILNGIWTSGGFCALACAFAVPSVFPAHPLSDIANRAAAPARTVREPKSPREILVSVRLMGMNLRPALRAFEFRRAFEVAARRGQDAIVTQGRIVIERGRTSS